jgi:ribonuclease R
MLVNEMGDVQAYQFYPAVICSHARLTYTEVAAALANSRGPEATKRRALMPHLLDLHDVYRALLKARAVRGAVDFETTETQIVCDENGRIEKIVPRVRNDAHRLIEEAMLAANVCAADFVAGAEHASLYRVHEGPTPEKRVTLQNYLKALGLGLAISDEPKPGEFQAIATATKDRPDAQQIHTMLLRSMQQAIYTPANSGHFGLAYEAYTHFTSPIRRYPDLLVHRVIKAVLQSRRYHLDTGDLAKAPPIKLRKGAKPASKLPTKVPTGELAHWEQAGAHCSANERRADEASRDVEAWLKCRYMREHLGEEYSGTVSAVTSFGLFVMLDQMYVEGLVHVTELGGDYYRFDELRQELRGERTGVRYQIGTQLEVQVSRVDLDARRIDFRLAGDDEQRPPGPRNKGDDEGRAERGERNRDERGERKGKSRKQRQAPASAGQGQSQPAAGQADRSGKAGGGRAARSAARAPRAPRAAGHEPASPAAESGKRRKANKRK